VIYLVLSVLSSTLIYMVFKIFRSFNINVLNALIVNYVTAAVFGFSLQSTSVDLASLPSFNWFVPAAFLGIFFICIFYLMAMTTEKHGMSVVSVASKMSLSIPVVFVIFYFSEVVTAIKIIGILFALISVYLVSSGEGEGLKFKFKTLLLPFAVFLGSGIIETSIKILQQDYVPSVETPVFSASIFLFAALTGSVIFIVRLVRKKVFIGIKDILAGVALGIPNYFSIYFLIEALRNPNLDSSVVFVINNVSIVLLSTLVGVLLFKEHLVRKNKIGILIAIISIVLVALSS